MTDPNPIIDALLASGRLELTTTPTEDTAVIDAETPTDPIPAEGAPHAWVAVQRRHSVNADRPEWDHRAVVIPAHDTVELDYARARDITLLPIGPDGDTGTRAIVEPRRAGTIAELAALPVGSIVLANDQAWTLHWPGTGWSVCPSCEITYCAEDLLDYTGEPVTVLHVPAEVTA